jgi:dTDP-glucose 4,6-dehydratase
VNVRPFTFIGPYQALSGPWAVNNFILDAMSNRSIKVLGDGRTVRSLMYGSDMAFWILTFLTKSEAGLTYNLGSGQEHTVAELAGMVSCNVKSLPDIVFNSGVEKSSLSRFVPDISLAESRFALKKTVSTESAIKRTIEWNASL